MSPILTFLPVAIFNSVVAGILIAILLNKEIGITIGICIYSAWWIAANIAGEIRKEK